MFACSILKLMEEGVVQYTQLESIRLWYLRFDKLEIDSWTPFHTVDLDFKGGLKMLSIRVDSIESTRIVPIHWGLWPRFKNEEGSCIVILRILTFGGLCRMCWKCCWFDSIRSNRHKSFPQLSIRQAGSRFVRRDSVWIESRRNMQIVKCFRRIDSVSVYWTWMKYWG